MVFACQTSTTAPATGLPSMSRTWPCMNRTSPCSDAVVQPRLALGERGAGDVERPLDGARRAALDPGLALRLVHPQVEEGLDAEAGDQQADLVGLAERGQVARPPTRIRPAGRRNPRSVRNMSDTSAMHDVLQPRVAAARCSRPLTLRQQFLHIGGVRSGMSVIVFLLDWWSARRMRSGAVVSQGRPPATGRVTPVM